jgi:GTPase SAR1 family protein
MCMEYLVEHIEWLTEQISDYGEDYLIFDCPGQIELYFHLPVMKTIVGHLSDMGYSCCGAYLIDRCGDDVRQ